MMERVLRVKVVCFVIERSDPPNLIVTAEGEVTTGGWTEAQLLRREYVRGPTEDDLWEYDLIAKPPDGPVTQQIGTVKASHRWEGFNEPSVRGVRVFGVGRGAKEVRFTEGSNSGCSGDEVNNG